MAVDVVMPQMGESIAEGTVTKWMKKQGDRVERDEPLFEISTDKVDAEIPSPASGILSEILAPEGKTVPVNSVVARLQTEGGAAAGAPKSEDEKTLEQPKPGEAKVTEAKAPEAKAAQQSTRQEVAQQAPSAAPPPPSRPQPVPAAASMAAPRPAPAPQRESQPSDKVASLDERRRTRSSPLVRKIARENDVDIAHIEGTGISGRVTKRDILQYLESPQTQEQDFEPEQKQPRRAAEPGERRPTPALTQRTETMSVMRKRIADHMVASRRTSAHVTTVFEVDFTEVDKLRRRYKKGYEERGAKLTYLPFIVQAIITAIREFPVINASIDGDKVVYHGEVNVGIAVALDWGLIVPVLRHADEKNVLGLARAIADLGERARQKKLNPEEVQGGTFTITNPGIFGGLFGTPIINQPQVAILGVGGVKKRAVVIETEQGDAIVVRSMAYLALSFDHRLIDGAVADQFMARVKEIIEAGDFAM